MDTHGRSDSRCCMPTQRMAFVSEAPSFERWIVEAGAIGLLWTLENAPRSTRIFRAGTVPIVSSRLMPTVLELARFSGRRHDAAMKPMHDGATTVAEIRERVMNFARERDWEQFHSPKNLSMALAAESGELMEHFLWTESGASADVLRDPKKSEAIADELADVAIYALEFANIAKIDLAAAIERKLAKNAVKYPVEKAKGRAAKYNEL
jgi:dCTP diphosphatase